MRIPPALLLAPMIALAACTGVGNGPPLVSAQSPPGTGLVNATSEPQPITSLPPGAANFGPGPSAVQPNWASVTFGGL